MNLFLIDGNSLLNICFYGTAGFDWTKGDKSVLRKRIRQTQEGILTNGVFTMSETLINLMVPNQKNFMAVAWDVNRDKIFRKNIYADYKGTRGDADEELKAQFPIMKEVLNALGIPQFEVETFEADDIIGTFVKKFEKQLPIKIVTKDKDSFQLISEHTSVWYKDGKASQWKREFEEKGGTYNPFVNSKFFEFNVDTLKHFYDLEPQQIIDWKALEGDSSDNIPGVSGVGPKAAMPLIKHFGTIESIYEYVDNHDENTAKVFFKELGISRSPYNKLLDGRDDAFMSKQLATIVCDMPHFDGLEIYDLVVKPNINLVSQVFGKYELGDLIKR